MASASAVSADSALARLARGRQFALYLQVADRCNHHCAHCYQVHGQRSELTLEQILTLLREFRSRGGFLVTVSGGEATLRSDLIDILVGARNLGLATVLYTNGFAITEELARNIAQSGVWRVEVSLYSDVPAEHDTVTRVSGSWFATIRAVKQLRAVNVNVRLKMTALGIVGASVERMEALARQLGCSLHIGLGVMPTEHGESGPCELRAEPQKAAALAIGRRELAPTDRPCSAGLSSLTVRSDGALLPCPNLQIELGQVRTDDNRWVQRDDIAQFFRDLSWDRLHGCRDCDLKSYCSRCHATAIAEGGDLLGPYAAACALALARYRAEHGSVGVLQSASTSSRTQASETGPFRIGADGLLAIPDVVTAVDYELRRRFGWIQKAASAPLVRLRLSRDHDGLDAGSRVT